MQKVNYLDFKSDVRVYKNEYLAAVKRVLNSGWYILGNEVESFEKEFAKYLGVKYCVGTANGLEAIQIALMAYGIEKDDEVITTPVSAVATTLAILAVGATPVFADVSANGQMDINQIEKLITKKTKAIIPVDLYGQPCGLDEIRKICKEHKLFLVEDACQAHGATYNNKKLGTFGDVGCFSFYPTKNIGAFGDGGALVTNNSKLDKIYRVLRDYGQQSKYIHTRYGLNSRLDELQAALLKIKLSYLDSNNDKRRIIAQRYIAKLSVEKDLKLVLPKNIEDSNFHLFVIRTSKREALQGYLKNKGISTLIHYPIAIPDQPMFGTKYKDLKISEARKFVKETLSLPCHPFIKLDEVDYVSDKIVEFFRK